MKSDIRKLGLGYNELVARWVEYNTEEERNISSDERSLFIHGISKNDAMRLGKKYHQSSVIIKDNNSCEEICTTPFPYEDNGSVKEFNIGDVVRTYNISGDKVLNIEDAKEIFANKKSGPSSKSVKGKTPFTFKQTEDLKLEVWDVESPRAAYFHTPNDERYLRVF
ncbi:hypothetical protein [uncultured Clostridium sp.]|uniref:hypothetical protein n=1 Tax=uncultured Clostridium sp. TaxID=59620 RepID=UPI00350E550D